MHITPDLLEAGYELVRLTPPFRGWKMPHADEIYFAVGAARDRYGHFRAGLNGARHEILISASCVGSLDMLQRTMMHEMVHLEDFRRTGDGVSHGRNFKKLAAQVCRYHHLDPKAF